ncbi:hypothetical protein [Ewingella americana]|uniref:hypothetical protein n=1 Tax=Ewingella americana TaxID=41202 RepID=UPI0012AD2347|nr:hypothetical protein [Ewingella americana]MRT01914.1 hypothetical protein [Ewingella americana]
MRAVKVERDNLGFWAHPEYFEPENGESGFPGEFDKWLSKENLQSSILSLEDDVDASDFAERYADGEFDADVSGWEPAKPDGDGWFIGSIHDTEDGPYCIWLRDKNLAT